jgi:hypothetical protein
MYPSEQPEIEQPEGTEELGKVNLDDSKDGKVLNGNQHLDTIRMGEGNIDYYPARYLIKDSKGILDTIEETKDGYKKYHKF